MTFIWTSPFNLSLSLPSYSYISRMCNLEMCQNVLWAKEQWASSARLASPLNQWDQLKTNFTHFSHRTPVSFTFCKLIAKDDRWYWIHTLSYHFTIHTFATWKCALWMNHPRAKGKIVIAPVKKGSEMHRISITFSWYGAGSNWM